MKNTHNRNTNKHSKVETQNKEPLKHKDKAHTGDTKEMRREKIQGTKTEI